MTIPSAGGIPFAFALQNAGGGLSAPTYKSNHASYTPCTDANFKLMPAVTSSFAPIEGYDQFEREVDEGYHPTGLFKSYLAGGGRVGLYPRLQNNIGELLMATVGGLGTHKNSDATHAKATVFQPPASALAFPWLTVRRYIDAAEDADKEGEEIRDCRVASAVFQAGAGGPLVGTFGLLGLNPGWDASFSAFKDSLTDGNESINTTPVAMEGIGPILTQLSGKGDLGTESGAEQPTIGVQVAIANGFSGSRPQAELVVGSYTPDDMVLVDQAFTVSFTLKWRNPRLYRAILRGSTTATAWTPRVTRTALDFHLGSQDYATGTIPYRLHFRAAEVAWQMSPIELRGGGFLVTQLTGVAQRQATPGATFQMYLENNVSYAGLTYGGAW